MSKGLYFRVKINGHMKYIVVIDKGDIDPEIEEAKDKELSFEVAL